MRGKFSISSVIIAVLATYIAVSGETPTLTRLFPLLDSQHSLYAVKGLPEYVLQASSDKSGDLRKVQVVPKFFFEQYHSDWTQPTADVVMQQTEYEDTLRQIEFVKPIGSLLQRGRVGTMFNLKLHFTDEYERAMVERAMFRRSPDEDYQVAWFSLNYFRTVSGKVQAKSTQIDGAHTIKIAGCWYWTQKLAFDRVTQGNEVEVEAAGPISETPGCKEQPIQ